MNGPRGVRSPVGALAQRSAIKPMSTGPAMAPIKNGTANNMECGLPPLRETTKAVMPLTDDALVLIDAFAQS